MATMQEAIARLRMIFETQGADAAAAEMKKLEASSTSLGTSSLNLDRAFTGLERRYSETARATAEYERSMRTLNAAVAQNPALAERAAAVQQTIAARYQATMQATKQAHEAQTAYGVGLQAMAAQATAASASTGILGSMLQTFGKGGTAAAIGIGAAVLAFRKLDEGVHATAQYARDIKNFADATGLTTAQVQGLNKEASRFGISTDEMRSGLMRFTSTFDEVRGGGGALLDIIRKIDSGLGEQALSAANEEEALNVLAAAYRKAGDEFERARLLRAAFGRGGQAMAPLIENLDLGKITEKYAGRGLSDDMIKDLRRLEGEIATIGSNVSNKIYSLFAVPWLEAEKAILKYMETAVKNATSLGKGGITPTSEDIPELFDKQAKLIENAERLRQLLDQPQGKATFAAMMQDMEKIKESLKTVDYWLEKLQATKPGGGGLTSGEPSFEARAKDAQSLAQTLGGLATVQEQVLASTYQLEAAYKALGTEGKARIDELRDSLEALMQVRAEMSQVAPGTYDRQLAAIQAIKAEYPGLVAQDAIRMSKLDDQLRIAQAMPGVARMAAEEQARINQLLLEGKELTLATTIAAKERAVAQAQINANARQTVAALRDQAAVAGAVTGAERIAAEAAATFNGLVRQGVSELLAGEVAAQGQANAIAAVNANVQRQVISLNESTQLIRAQVADMEAQHGAAQKILGTNEMNVRTQQAFNQAVREGASAEQAAAVAAATLTNLLAQQAQQAAQAVQAANQQRRAAALAADAEAEREADIHTRITDIFTAPLQTLTSLESQGSLAAHRELEDYRRLGGMPGNAAIGLADVIAGAQREVANKPKVTQAQDALLAAQHALELSRVTDEEQKARMQAEFDRQDMIRGGMNPQMAQQIASLKLETALNDLKKSVDQNTEAQQAALDPIYTQGRAALRIGYYGEGSGGTMRTVTATGYGAANENLPMPQLPAAPAAPSAQETGRGNLVVVNNMFTAAAMGDRRTQYQAANAYGRAIANI